jgi:trehalose/maltose hydrolase-like predicted phosphorylase
MSYLEKLFKIPISNRFISRSVTHQLHDLSTRFDILETSLKKDVRTILDILHQQQQMQLQLQQQQHQHLQHQQLQQQPQHPQHSHQQQTGKPTTSYQPSESEFSFDNMSTIGGASSTIDKQQPHGQQQQQRGIVQRSVSQPECTNESKSLFR